MSTARCAEPPAEVLPATFGTSRRAARRRVHDRRRRRLGRSAHERRLGLDRLLGDPEGEIRTSGGSVEIFVREDANASRRALERR
jgi:hypothetical protein